jgi:DNA-binding XRE family transcriptional regulator
MKKTIKMPRILKIEAVKGFTVTCIFNNGETRALDFKGLFKKWKITRKDPEYLLLDEHEFGKVMLRNQTLSWKNIQIELPDLKGNKVVHPYELSPDLLYKESRPVKGQGRHFYFGSIIKKTRIRNGLSQDQLAALSGTSKTYISRVENDLIEPELSTLYKIVELGLGKKIKVEIE